MFNLVGYLMMLGALTGILVSAGIVVLVYILISPVLLILYLIKRKP